MFEVWGRFVFRHRLVVLVISAVVLVASGLVLTRGATLTTGLVEGTEAQETRLLLERDLGRALSSTFDVVLHDDRRTTDDPGFRADVASALTAVRNDPRVASVHTPFDEGIPPQIARTMLGAHGHDAYARVALKADFGSATRVYPSVRDEVRSDTLALTFTGILGFRHDLDQTLAHDLLRAELISIPLALVVLLAVFGTLVAAALPLGVGGLAVVGGVAGVFILSRYVDVASYAINIVTLIGLGVAIDYSLFIVKRYREELDHGRTVPDALVVAIATAGKAVAFSGIAVATGLSGLLFYPRSYLASMGMAGSIVVVLAVVYALTFLPALLGVIGHGISRFRVPLPSLGGRADGLWHAGALWVMRRPLLVLVPTLAFMVSLGTPFLHIDLATPGPSVLPDETEARRGMLLMEREMPDALANRVAVAIRYEHGPVMTPERVGAAYDLSHRIARMPGVVRVESVVDLDPRLTRENYQTMSVMPQTYMPSALKQAYRDSVGEHTITMAVVVNGEMSSPVARALVHAIRANRVAGDGTVLVTGPTAFDVDTMDFVRSHTPRAIAFVMAMTYVILFLLLGSVLLPVKAVAMNLLSISSSFGALVFIFQEGHFARALHFTPAPIDPSLPVILFCIVFGLSMDYEVLLLTRMQEEYLRTGDNTRAVAEGLERSGRLITSAAAIMVAVFLAFAMAQVVLVKAVGLGMATAVLLDATIVRLLIVPSTMRLFGDLNWWAPAPLARLYQRVGLSAREG